MTILPRVALPAGQAPRVCNRPAFATEAAGVEAIELAESVGLILDPWQQLFVRVALAEREDGKWAADEVAELVARQNGKGAGLEAIVLHGMFLVGDPLTLWTAHQFKTTQEAFLRIRGWVDGSNDLRRMVRRVTTGNGDEGIELTNGVRLRFIARSKSSGRGFSPQRIVFDEAQELSTLAVDAMLPSMSAQANKQSLYAGTVPSEENNSEHWERMRDRGRGGKSPQLAWMEWTPTGSEAPETAEKIDMDSRKVWRQSSPAWGYRITEASIASERESMSPASFGRERLSIWPTIPAGGGVIDMVAWATLADKNAEMANPVALALDVSPDRRSGSISAAGICSEGLTLVEVLEHRAGTGWMVDRLAELVEQWSPCAVAVDPAGPAGSLIAELDERGIEFTKTTARDMAQACGQLFDGVAQSTVRHRDQANLNMALKGAKKRKLGEAWAWDRLGASTDLSPLVASTLALWAHNTFGSATPVDVAMNVW